MNFQMQLHAARGLAAIYLVCGASALAQTSTVQRQEVRAPNPQGRESTKPRDSSDAARLTLARLHGVDPASLQLLQRARASYPNLGATVEDFKFRGPNGVALRLALDDAGDVQDTAVLQVREDAARSARFGRLDEPLAWLLTQVTESDRIPVALWLMEPDSEAIERPLPEVAEALFDDPAHAEALELELDRSRAVEVARVTSPILQRLLDMGLRATAEEFAPLIFAELTPDEVRLVAQWSEVDRVYSAPPAKSTMESARAEILVGPVQSAGITGAGIKLAQVEVGGRVALNFLMLPIVQDSTYVCSTPNDHATAVAGILKSILPNAFGIAYGAALYATGACGGDLAQLMNRSSAAMGWGARALNLSFGLDTNRVPGVMDRFYDNMVISRWRSIIASAGNEGQIDGDVTSPALGYNTIAVGNFDEGATTWWYDDFMNATSSYRNPITTHSDRQKPDLAAPGTRIRTTLNNGGFGANYSSWPYSEISGTSFAAPMVTGTVALMMQRNAGLKFWPEAVKAILMTTAINNIEGAARLSDKDGAGGLNAWLADTIVQRQEGDWGGMAYNCSYPQDHDVKTVYVGGGLRMRAAIAWDTASNFSGYGTRPCADLDLHIIGPNCVLSSSSSSYDSSSEIADFVAPVSGYYTIRVHKWSCEQAPRYLGWACWVEQPIG